MVVNNWWCWHICKGSENGEEIAHKMMILVMLTLNKQFPVLTKKFLLMNSERGQACMRVSEVSVREKKLSQQFPFLSKKFLLRNSKEQSVAERWQLVGSLTSLLPN